MDKTDITQRVLRIGAFLVLLGAFLAVNAVHTRASRTTPEPAAPTVPPDPKFSNASLSIDDLVNRFLSAVEANDDHAVEALRVTEAEYRDIILPGSVEPGQPAQRYRDQESEYFWGVLNGKSLYSRAIMMHAYGGKNFKLQKFDFRKGVRNWAGYKAYEKLELTLKAEDGQVIQLPTGSIAEVGGQFKFVSFIPAG